MNSIEEKIKKCYNSIKNKVDFCPEIAIVLGSGLGEFSKNIEISYTIEFSDIEGFPVSTVEGHKGRFIFGYLSKIPVVCMQGRVHYYEGYQMSDVVLPIRVMKMLGAHTLFLTNAAGGINPSFKAGDLMLITDHISSFVPSALKGANLDFLGTRFPDMSNVYDAKLQNIMVSTAAKQGIELQKGVYLQASGPNFETPAEIQMFKTLGASAVGMSTACEAMAAVHAGMKVVGISLISNMAAGIQKEPLSHREVQETAHKASKKITKLLLSSISAIC